MENLEEVLQALDEFQKTRPSEIPRELEDYLCWVAKTGDPVYQWSLIKTLFREKLTRVMTDFYESCPTLELTPCPNVEHFNYDTMKSNLLERLESFANAPFTVQRICELLTAPRKEYNRVDKFMRAIEKNILVVSTREPGSVARRSENGDGMVNGSVDETASVTQPPQDVEMDWERDCSPTVTISVHTVENETPLLHTVIPSTTTITKNMFGSEDNEGKQDLSTSRTENSMSNFIETAPEFTAVTNLASQAQTQDSTTASNMQNLSNIVPEASAIVGDVPEAIMNEDTSSQPSLDLEDDPKAKEKTESGTLVMGMEEEAANSMKNNQIEMKTTSNLKATTIENETPNVAAENLLKSDISIINKNISSESNIPDTQDNVQEHRPEVEDKKSIVLESKDTETDCSVSNSEELNCTSTKSYDLEKNETVLSEICTNSSLISDSIAESKALQNVEDSKEIFADTSAGMNVVNNEYTQTNNEATELGREDAKPIVEDSVSKSSNVLENKKNTDSEKDSLTIVEAIDEEDRVTKSMVPDPIPIIEEPKDSENNGRNLENVSSCVEVTEETKGDLPSSNCQSKENSMSTKSNDIEDAQGNAVKSTSKAKENDSLITNNVTCKKECESTELMDVDDEQSLSMFRQEEPMEQETLELAKS